MFNTTMPARVLINEVATRDGFQSEASFVPTDEKIALIDHLSQVGLNKIEVTSFVSPRAIPNLRDAEEVMQRITRNPQVCYTTLVPNEKGAERAMACNADEINLAMSVSETHNLANMRMTCEESLSQFKRICDLVAPSGMRINGSLATTFGCPFEGVLSADKVLTLIERYLEAGIQSISLCDTTGMAAPQQVYDLCTLVRSRFAHIELTLHLHNTRGMGLANVMAGLSAGINQFDASLGGIGGCPYAPGATGNICTEDLVHMLEANGLDTQVDLQQLIALAKQLPDLLGHDLPGQVAKAGLRTETRPVPASVEELRKSKVTLAAAKPF